MIEPSCAGVLSKQCDWPNLALKAGAARVYVVDDDSMTRRSLSFALTTAGWDVRSFCSGQDFLEEVNFLSAGCVLLDLRMPEVDGFGVLEQLGSRLQGFPVVVITGHGDVEVAVRAMKLGAKDFLEKPFRDDALIAILADLTRTLPAVAQAAAERLQAIAIIEQLTPRERQTLAVLVAGQPNKIAADRLKISVRTIEMHRSNLMKKMNVKSLAEVRRLAILAEFRSAHTIA